MIFTRDLKNNSLLLLSSSILGFLCLTCERDFLEFTRVSLTATGAKEGADAPGPQKMWDPLFSMTRPHKGCAGIRCLPLLFHSCQIGLHKCWDNTGKQNGRKLQRTRAGEEAS